MSDLLHLINGDILLHKKGKYYKVLEVKAKHSETQEEVVIYQSIETKEVWVRPLEMFTKDRFQIAIKSEHIRK